MKEESESAKKCLDGAETEGNGGGEKGEDNEGIEEEVEIVLNVPLVGETQKSTSNYSSVLAHIQRILLTTLPLPHPMTFSPHDPR